MYAYHCKEYDHYQENAQLTDEELKRADVHHRPPIAYRVGNGTDPRTGDTRVTNRVFEV